jgi:hypothetical protein
MIFKPRNVLSRIVLPCLGIALSLSLTPAHAMQHFFPDDVLKSTFKQLSAAHDLENCELVCSRWNKLLSADALWEEVARRYAKNGEKLFSNFYFEAFPPSWKMILKETSRYVKTDLNEATNKLMLDFDEKNGVFVLYSLAFKNNPKAPSYIREMPSYVSFQDIEKAQEKRRVSQSSLVKLRQRLKSTRLAETTCSLPGMTTLRIPLFGNIQK